MGNTTLPPEKLQEHALSTMAASRASSDPLPGPLSNAFSPGPVMVGDIPVRKVVAADWETLKLLDSPLLKLIAELQQSKGVEPPNVPVTNQEQYDLCWIFTHTPDEVENLVVQGKEQFQARSREIAKQIDAPCIDLINVAIMEQIMRSWKTANKYAEDMKNKGVTFFTEPPTAQPTA